ncbi:MAG: hypothetical protein II942_05280 [Alphaproteobacteria bacterium]|nr:hypothetical protein [Alphaproteobacteria bacterium]
MIEIEREFDERSRFWGMVVRTDEGQKLQVECNPSRKGEVRKVLLFDKNGACTVWSREAMQGRCVDISDDAMHHTGVRVYVSKEGRLAKLEAHDEAVVKMDGVIIDEASIKRRKRMLNPYDKKLGPQKDLIMQRLAIIAAVKKIDDIQKLATIRARAEKVLNQQKKAKAR